MKPPYRASPVESLIGALVAAMVFLAGTWIPIPVRADALFVATEGEFAIAVPDGWVFEPQRMEKNYMLRTGKGEMVMLRYFDGVTEIDDVYQPTVKLLTESLLKNPQLASSPVDGSMDEWRRRLALYTGLVSDKNLVAGGNAGAVMLREGGVGFIAVIIGTSPDRYKEMLEQTTRMFQSIRMPASGEKGTVQVAPPPPRAAVTASGEIAWNFDVASGWENKDPARRYARPVLGLLSSSQFEAAMIVMSFDGMRLDREAMRNVLKKTAEAGIRKASLAASRSDLKTSAGRSVDLTIYDGVALAGKEIPMQVVTVLAESASGHTGFTLYVPATNAAATMQDLIKMATSVR